MNTNISELFDKPTKDMSERELVMFLRDIHSKILEVLSDEDRSMAYFYLGAASAASFELEQRYSKKVQTPGENYYFLFDSFESEEYDEESNGIYIFAIVDRTWWDSNKSIRDKHISNSMPKQLLDSEYLGGEISESYFEVYGEDEAECIHRLTKLGMTYMGDMYGNYA